MLLRALYYCVYTQWLCTRNYVFIYSKLMSCCVYIGTNTRFQKILHWNIPKKQNSFQKGNHSLYIQIFSNHSIVLCSSVQNKNSSDFVVITESISCLFSLCFFLYLCLLFFVPSWHGKWTLKLIWNVHHCDIDIHLFHNFSSA